MSAGTPAPSSGATIRPPSLRARRAREGFFIGVGLTAALTGLQYVGYMALRLPFMPYLIGEVLRDLTPGALKTASIETLAYAAKGLLVVVSVALYVALGGLVAAGFGAFRDRLPVNGWVRGLIAGAALFVITLPIAIARDWVPADYLFGPLGLLAMCVLWGLALNQTIIGANARPNLPVDVDAGTLTRRAFLVQTAAGGVVVGVIGIAIGRIVESGLFRIGANLGAPVPAPTPDADGFVAAAGTPPEITPNDKFYVVDIGVSGPPRLALDSWKLAIDGLVETPRSYTFDQLSTAFSRVPPFVGTLMCISNPVGGDLTSTAIWEGVRLAEVLNAAVVKPTVKDVVFRCADGYSDSLPLAAALDPDTYLVYRMNGVPLPTEHGYPVRVYIPTRYGEKNPKWITSIELVDYDYKGYWQQQGWTDDATIRHSATIYAADGLNHVNMPVPGRAEVGGTANGGGLGVAKVEISVNDGPWQSATLKKPLSKFSWVLWKVQFPAEPDKRYTVRARATNGAGAPQIEASNPPHPDGSTGYHQRVVFPTQPAGQGLNAPVIIPNAPTPAPASSATPKP